MRAICGSIRGSSSIETGRQDPMENQAGNQETRENRKGQMGDWPDKEITDKILAAAIRVHRELGPGYLESIYEEAFSAELASELPLLASGQIMAAAVKAGVGREDAHSIIGEQARNLLAARREGEPFSLAHALAKEARLGLSESAISEIIESTGDTLGQSVDQVAEVVEAVAALIALNPSWAKYQPGKSV